MVRRRIGFPIMLELEHKDYWCAGRAFADLIPLHGSVAAVLAGAAEGRVLVDNADAPGLALLHGPEGLYLGGSPLPGVDYSRYRPAIDGWAYLYPTSQWQERLAEVLPHPFMLVHDRIRLTITPKAIAPLSPPPGFSLVPDEEPLGFCILDGDRMVSRCGPDLVAGTYAEIGVWTHPDYRRQGLARVAATACLSALAAAGIAEVGWHCLASNRGSLALARRLGFGAAQPYQARSASLPAENVGDLDTEASRTLAAHFEAGSATIDWLGFHAAGGWALAGETGRALAAIERLVAGPWPGESQWLEGHWALAGLRAEPRFIASVARQAAK